MARTRSARRSRLAAALASAATILALVGSSASFAQDPPKDDDLDRLLEKLEGNKPAPAAEPAPKPKKDDTKDKDKAKPKEEKPKDEKAKTKDDKAKPKPVEPEDKTLDSLLEKLGETKEAPETTGPATAPPPDAKLPNEPTEPMPGGKPEDVSAGKLNDRQKSLDEHLEEISGVIKPKKPQDGQDQGQQGQDQDDTPIGRAVKKMREVETKLGDAETGEETRKKQGEIIKDLEQLIAEAKKQAQGQGQGQRRRSRQPGQQPGDQPDDQPGTDPNARGAGAMAPKKPTDKPILVGGKDIWGNLPAMIREDMENVFSTLPLPKKTRQISRYYESLAKKGSSSTRGNP